jgi:hypothetical protein
VVNFAVSAALFPGSLLNPLRRRLGERLNRSGRYGEKKKLLPIPEIERRILGRSARGVVAVPIELSCSSLLKHSIVI